MAVKNYKTKQNFLYGAGFVAGVTAVYFLIGVKFGMPNPLKPKGKTKKEIQDDIFGN